jgi:hypothetical protein
MRRKLLILAALAVAAGGYSFYWYSVAELVRGGILDWSAARREEGFTVGWDRYEVSGFPLALRVTIEKPVFGQRGVEPGYMARGPLLIAEARPWALSQWHVSAAQGATLAVEPGPERPAITVAAAALAGTIAPRQGDAAASTPGTDVAVNADGITVAGQADLAIAHASAQAMIPAHAVASHLDTSFSSSLDLRGMTLPEAVPSLGDTIDHITATVAVKGSIPEGPHRQALAAWRDDGGTLEIGALDLGWGNLVLGAKGTLALDAALQPVGAMTALVRGYNEIIDALVSGGNLRAGDGAMAKLALGLLAKEGPDGEYEISAPLTLQNGYVYIGPAKVARMPVFTWE